MPINLAIVGFAHGHVDAYASEIAGMEDARIVAGWDHDAERGAARCEAHGFEFVPKLGDLLARDDVGGAIIGSETAYHADNVEAAARAGKDILLQKPMALTLGTATASCGRWNRRACASAWHGRCAATRRTCGCATRCGRARSARS